MKLRRLDDISITPAVLTLLPVRNHTMFALTLCDGSVQFRHRNTFEVIMPDDNTDEVQMLPLSGFAFNQLEPCRSQCTSEGVCNSNHELQV